MQQAMQKNSPGVCIQDAGNEGGIKLAVAGLLDVALNLSTQQARALACDLIQQVHRAETSMHLKNKNA
jgi:hypothetical protein